MGRMKAGKKKITLAIKTNANWQWFSPCVILNCILIALNVNIHLSSQALQPRDIMAKARPVIPVQAGVLTWAFKGFAFTICMHTHTQCSLQALVLCECIGSPCSPTEIPGCCSRPRSTMGRTCPSSRLPQDMTSRAGKMVCLGFLLTQNAA